MKIGSGHGGRSVEERKAPQPPLSAFRRVPSLLPNSLERDTGWQGEARMCLNLVQRKNDIKKETKKERQKGRKEGKSNSDGLHLNSVSPIEETADLCDAWN